MVVPYTEVQLRVTSYNPLQCVTQIKQSQSSTILSQFDNLNKFPMCTYSVQQTRLFISKWVTYVTVSNFTSNKMAQQKCIFSLITCSSPISHSRKLICNTLHLCEKVGLRQTRLLLCIRYCQCLCHCCVFYPQTTPIFALPFISHYTSTSVCM